MCECEPNLLSCACRECGVCLSVGLVNFNFMGNILSAELCEEKIDYPEKLSKQDKETAGVKCVRVSLQPYGTPHSSTTP